MRKIISNYHHRVGSHCGSTLMSNILNCYGYNYNEDICFGLGAGLGFLYRKSWNPPLYMVLGRGHDIEDKVSQHLGFFASTNITLDNETAWNDVKEEIDRNHPVLVDVDASVLTYIKSKFNLFDYVRYGGHRVCVVGYDDEKHTVLLSDYAWSEIQEISLCEFIEARSSEIGEFPSKNLNFRFYFPEKLVSLEEAIIKGIGSNVHTMMYPTTRQTGLMGMEKFTRQVTYWTIENTEQHVMKNAYITYMMLEKVGTGGGNFRRIYSRFMNEAGKRLKDEWFFGMAERYWELAEMWSQISKLLFQSSKDIHVGIFSKENDAAQQLLNEVYEREADCIYELKNRIENNYSNARYEFLK